MLPRMISYAGNFEDVLLQRASPINSMAFTLMLGRMIRSMAR